ncbi:MAG TPA: DNA-3-methyladenine glycosylase [Acidisarcina sp.]|nr:DNA-3-methyladenine glycosylase [Acidisarcina sp.]
MLREKEALPLPRSFYNASPEVVARKLLGRILVARSGGFQLAGRIVEVEAYLGVTDPAAHAFSGITPRNAVLFGEPGHAYVYFIYGMYSCLNVSCEPQGKAGCVLFRALEPLHLSVSNGDAGDPSAEEVLRRNRGLAPLAPARLIASGPGRLSQAFGITRASHNGVDLTSPASPLQIVDDDFRAGEIVATPRIGIRKAVEHPLRFYLAGNAFVSGKVSGRR